MNVVNSKLIKSLAFEKIVIEVIRLKNPHIQNNCYYAGGDINLDKEIEYFNRYGSRFQYDIIARNQLDLSAFGKEIIKAPKIVVEIKADRSPIDTLLRFVERAEKLFDVIVFIINTSPKEIYTKVKSNRARIYFLYYEDLINDIIIREFLHSLDDYISKKDNLLISDNYSFLNDKIKKNLSFALGAGCSRKSKISDWNTLSESLGYELLYDIVDTKESAFKNKVITDALNNSIFSCYDKTSALDAIYNSYIKLPSIGRRDYWLAIKRVLYMNYDSPNDARQPLVDEIVKCISRNKISEIINYNFDSVIEQNINSSYKSKSNEIKNSTTNLNNCAIYHVHGYIPYDYDGKTDVNNFIFTDKEYYDNMMDENSFTNKTQTNIFLNRNVIFVGVSFTDSNMKEILRRRVARGENSNLIFAFLKLPNFDFNGTNNQLMENKYKLIQQCYFDTLGVKILWVHNYDEIPNKIAQL
ncbi:MAG: SIR2 family protein [Bacilli bacterium]|nr:SIR2 family protein [Bacilli bacterium]